MLNTFFKSLLLGFVLSATVQAQTIDQTDPYVMIEQVAHKLLTNYRDQQEAIAADPLVLRTLVETDLMPYVNSTYAAYKVMGTALRSATDEQKQAFTNAFREYMITTFAQAFSVYSDQSITYEPSRPVGDRSIISVKVIFVEGNRPPIEVQFKMRLNRNNGQWQAIDLAAEGASILAAKESEFSGLIRQRGLDAVIRMLEERNQEVLAGGDAS